MTRIVTLLVMLVLGCAPHRTRPRSPFLTDCAFTVANQAPYAMAVRLVVSYSSIEIGALNPGELLNHKVSCSQEMVYIRGVAIPPQVGAPTSNGSVLRWAQLSPGERVMIPLSWP